MTTLQELKQYVIAWNTVLREAVHQMEPIILLRNAHPADRGIFASKLLEEKLISKTEAIEFIRIVGR